MITFLYKTSKDKFGSGKGTKYQIPKTGFIWLHLTNPSGQEITKVRNDFSIWIRNTIKGEKLANELLQTKDRCRTQLLILRRIVEILTKNG